MVIRPILYYFKLNEGTCQGIFAELTNFYAATAPANQSPPREAGRGQGVLCTPCARVGRGAPRPCRRRREMNFCAAEGHILNRL